MKRSELIAKLIDEKGISRRSFAEEIGIPPTTLQSMITRGVGKASVDNVLKVCKGLGITAEDLENMATLLDNVGWILKEEREEKDITVKELSDVLRVSPEMLTQYEDDLEPISMYLFEKVANYFGLTWASLLEKYDQYDEYIPSHFNGDVDAYETFKKAVYYDAMNDQERHNDIDTIAAHHDGDEWSEEELEEIEQFKEFVRSKRKQQE